MTHIFVPSSIGIGLLGVSFSQGSDYEAPGKFGTSHLMEHLICKAFDHMLPQFKQLGIDYNAYTDNDRVVFWLKGLYESLQEVGSTVYDVVTNGKFVCTQESFEAEKNVVLQEYGDIFNTQVSAALENQLRKKFNYFGPIGLRSDIEKFSYQDYIDSIHLFTKPYKLVEVGETYVKPSQYDFVTKDEPKLTPIFGNYDAPLENVLKEDKTFMGIFSKIGIRDNILKNKIDLIVNCINDGLESPLAQEIREKRGLSYCSYGWNTTVTRVNHLVFGATTYNKNSEELRNVYNEFFVGNLSRHLTKERFEACFKNYMINKKMLQLLPHNWANSIILSDCDPYEGLDTFTYEEALELLQKHFVLENFEEFSY